MRSISVRWGLLGVVLIAIVVYGGTGLVRVGRASGAGHDHTVFSAQLPNVPGKTLTAIVVEYGPGGSSAAHRHAAASSPMYSPDKFARRIPRLGQCGVYRAGETFFEPPGSTHLVSANASDTEPASLLALFVADDHAQLTQPAR
jgi:quercetin dioxygenase-like cupin family protein